MSERLPWYLRARPLIMIFVPLLAIAITGAILGTRKASETTDRPSYAAGWLYVVERQPDAPGAASPELRSDTGIVYACQRYADGFAQLDGVTDVDAFLDGCADAARMTDLEPQEAS